MLMRRLELADASLATELVRRGYDAYVAPEWERDSAQEFARTQLSLEAMTRLISECAFSAGAFAEDGTLLGVIILPVPTWVALLFVDPQWFRQGIGMRLWEAARDSVRALRPPIEAVTLNASAFAVGFYLKAGFVAKEKVEKVAGRPATRMIWKVTP
jgi:GNAT superfamily N-acetyltransferase